MSANPNITLQYILNNKDKNWNWVYLSQNPGIKLEDIEENLNLSWQWCSVGGNPNITIKFILNHLDKFKDRTANLGGTSLITLEDIQNYPELFWNKEIISQNPNLTLEYFLNNRNAKWNYESIGRNSSIIDLKNVTLNKQLFDLEIIFNGEQKIIITNISDVINITKGLSMNPTITTDIVKKNKSIQWDFLEITKNPAISINDAFCVFNMLSENIDRNKIADLIILFGNTLNTAYCQNPNITLDWIFNNLNSLLDWGINGLSSNKLTYHPYFDQPIIIRV